MIWSLPHQTYHSIHYHTIEVLELWWSLLVLILNAPFEGCLFISRLLPLGLSVLRGGRRGVRRCPLKPPRLLFDLCDDDVAPETTDPFGDPVPRTSIGTIPIWPLLFWSCSIRGPRLSSSVWGTRAMFCPSASVRSSM